MQKMKYFLLTGLLFIQQSFLFACPNCKDALATESAKALAEGYYWSILLMVSLPFVITGSVAFLIIRSIRKKNVMS